MKLDGRLWIAENGDPLAGHGRIELLARIGSLGSISGAAKNLGISYKAAWDAVDAMNNLAGEALVERSTGGRGGGGTRLTARGERLVAAFRQIEDEHRRFLDALGAHIDDFAGTYQVLRRLNMKTSARNQLHGRVAAIRPGAVNDEIEIALRGGDRLFATITRESTRHLA
ncbi:MAG TPA: molybdenum-dependent transcriptional regulator, partial [Noviherbaspirillum sp.]|nr:molybdenum-dependent transcriptional regulator [Noviherbaspirillum sp.]